VAVAAGLAVVATLTASLLPALSASRSDLTPLLKRETAAFGRSRRVSRRDALVVGQLVVTFAFVVTAVLCSRSFSANLDAHLGFAPDRLLTLPVHPSRATAPAAFADELEALLERVRALPGVERATLASSPPAVRSMEAPVRAAEAGGETVRAAAGMVRGVFFEMGGVRLLRGRLIDETDVRFDRPVAVVGQALADRLWPAADPLGKTLRFGEHQAALEVIGVVADPVEVARVEQGAGRRGPPAIYLPLGPRATASAQAATLLVEGGAAVAALGPTIATLARDLHPGLALGGPRTVADLNRAGLIQVEITSVTYSLMGALCALLGAVGLYGCLAQVVARRTKEFGIRRALGAESRQILALVLRRGLILAGVALVLGLPAAFAAARIFGSAVPDLPPVDALTLLLGATLVLTVALAASYLPAARATRADPMVALRHD
jgi:predicted permease